MSTIQHVIGNLAKPESFIFDFQNTQDAVFLLHQTNCLGIMGAGVALALSKEYPAILPYYQQYCDLDLKKVAGSCLITTTGIPRIAVVNLFGQVTCGRGRRTNYEYLFTALEEFFRKLNDFPTAVVAIPKFMSSGLAGGNWNIVLAMIESFAVKYPNTIYIVEYQQ